MKYKTLQNLEGKIKTFHWFQSFNLQLFSMMSSIDKLAGKSLSFNYGGETKKKILKNSLWDD